MEEISNVLEKQNQISLRAVPGIVGPIDTNFMIMTKPVDAIVNLNSEDKILETQIKNGWKVSKVRFGEYGKRTVTVTCGEKIAQYCFFVTEPVQK